MAHDNQVKDESTKAPNSGDAEKTKKRQPKSTGSFATTLKSCLEKLCDVYRYEFDLELYMVWQDALKDMRPDMIEIGYHATLKRHEDFLPTPAQFRVYAEDASANMRIGYAQPIEQIRRRNTLDEVRDIVLELEPGYKSLDPRKHAKQIENLFRKANIVRYLRLGIEPKWIPAFELEELRKYASKEIPDEDIA